MKKTLFALVTFLLFAAVGCNNSQPDYEAVFDKNFTVYPNELTQASRGEMAETSLDAAMTKYESGEFKAALTDLNKYLDENPEYYKVKFYRGLVYLKMKELDPAISDLKEVVNKNAEFKEPAEWYLSLAYIRAKKTGEAVKLLEDMKENSKTQGEKAGYLLSQVENWPK